MHTVNETGSHAGRYLYATHHDTPHGALSVTDLASGHITMLADEPSWAPLDALRWTPWGSLLIAENTRSSRLFEVLLDPRDPSRARHVAHRPLLGAMRHEGIDIGADGSVYVIDEYGGGLVFRYLPTRPADLSHGVLSAARLTPDGDVEWAPLNPDLVLVDANEAARQVAATPLGRRCDLEMLAAQLCAAATPEDHVIAVGLAKQALAQYIAAGPGSWPWYDAPTPDMSAWADQLVD